MVNSGYIEFLSSKWYMLRVFPFREEITSLNKELQEKRLQTTYDRQKINDIQHKLREMESKANKLQAQNLKLTVKLEDMKKNSTSSRDSSVYNIKLESAELEKIPDFSPELANHLLGITALPTSGDDNFSDNQSVHVSCMHQWDVINLLVEVLRHNYSI